MEPILDIIFKRRSIRKYQKRKVGQKKIKSLLKAAMAAPSANNGQPWEFIVVTDKLILEHLRTKLTHGNYVAPAAIVVLGNLDLLQGKSSGRFWAQDCTAAVENILIAASGMGLGTVWIGSYPKEDVMKDEREILGIPEDVIPLALIYVGYPAEEQPPRTQYQDARVHWQKY